jgi:hypothetical protein
MSFFDKNSEQEGKTGPVWGDWYQWEVGRNIRKGCRKVNVVEILCTHAGK